MSIQAERTDTAVPVNLQVNKNGGVTGLTAVVSVRDAATTNSYLDFADNTFKTSGWTSVTTALTDIGAGVYTLSGGLDITAITNLPASTNNLILEFNFSGTETGDALDEITLANHIYDVAIQTDIVSDATPYLGANIDAAITTRATQAQILSDATPFAGANIDALISSRAVAGDAMTLALNAVNSTALDTSAVDEIVDAVWDESQAAHVAVGSTGESLNDAATGADPSAVADAVWDEARAGHVAAGSFGESVTVAAAGLATDAVNEIRDSILSDGTPFAGGDIDAAISTRAAPGDAMDLVAGAVDSTSVAASALNAIADSTWDEALAGHATAGSAGKALSDVDATVDTPANISTAVWSEPLPGTFGAGEAGDIIGDRVDATISSRSSHSAGAVWDEARASHTAGGSFGQTVVLTAAGQATDAVNEVRDAILSDSTPFSGANIDAAITSRAVAGDAMALTAGAETSVVDAVWDEPTVGHTSAGSTGQALIDASDAADASAISTAVWGEALPGAFGAGTAGERLATTDDTTGTNLDVLVSTRSAPGDAMDLVTDAVDSTSLAVSAAAEVADAVWDEAIAGHIGAGSTGETLVAAADDSGVADAVWAEALPGSFTAGQAGKIIGDNINATISSRSTLSASSASSAVWGESLPGAFGPGTAGERLATTDNTVGTNLDATVSSRSVAGDAMTLTSAERDAVIDGVWDELVSSTSHFTSGSTGEAMSIIKGLVQQNYMVDTTVFSGPLMTSARMRVFDNDTDTLAATDGGSGEGEIATFTMTAVPEVAGGAQMKTFKMTRTS